MKEIENSKHIRFAKCPNCQKELKFMQPWILILVLTFFPLVYAGIFYNVYIDQKGLGSLIGIIICFPLIIGMIILSIKLYKKPLYMNKPKRLACKCGLICDIILKEEIDTNGFKWEVLTHSIVPVTEKEQENLKSAKKIDDEPSINIKAQIERKSLEDSLKSDKDKPITKLSFSYLQKMLYSILSAVIFGGILAGLFEIDNKIRFGIIVGGITYFILSIFSSSKKLSFNKNSWLIDPDLIIASNDGNENILIKELEKGVDVNIKGKDEQTALMSAAYNGHTNIVKILLENGADVNLFDIDNVSALMYASLQGHIEIVKILIDRNAAINHLANSSSKTANTGYTALMGASLKGHNEVVQFLIEKGADINIKDDHNGRTALMIAAKEGQTKTLNLLIENGADINATNVDGITPLIGAAMIGNLECVKLLIDNNANINAFAKDGSSAINFAAIKGHTEIVHYLLNQGEYIQTVEKNNFILNPDEQELPETITIDIQGKGRIKNPSINKIIEAISSLDGEDKTVVNLIWKDHVVISAIKDNTDFGITVFQSQGIDNLFKTINKIDADLVVKLFLGFFNNQDLKHLTEWEKAIFDEKGVAIFESENQRKIENQELLESIEREVGKIEHLPEVDAEDVEKYQKIYSRKLSHIENAIINLWNRKVGLLENTYVYPYIPDKKLINAKKSYAKLNANSLVIALYTGDFINGKTGMLFTTDCVYLKDSSGKKYNFKYSELNISYISYDIHTGNMKILLGEDCKIETTFSDEKPIIAICKFLILASKYSQLEN